MRLYISTLTKRFVQSAAYTAPVEGFTFKRRDIEPIELHFINEQGVVEIPSRLLGKVLLVAGADPDFNGKYAPTGESENGKPVWAKGAFKILRVEQLTFAIAAVLLEGAPSSSFDGTYNPDGVINGKTRYKHTQNQNRFEWKPSVSTLGDGVEIVGQSTFAGLYLRDTTAVNGKHRYTRQGVGQISWKPAWSEQASDRFELINMAAGGIDFNGTYRLAASPYNNRSRWYRLGSGSQITSSIQFESAYSSETEDAQGSNERIPIVTGTGGHFSLNLNGHFVKSTGNNVPNVGTSVDQWTLGNNEAYIVSRPAGTYTNPYRLNMPNIGYTTSGSYLGGNSWFLDDALHNNQPQWNFSSFSNPVCFLRYDDPTNRKWRIIQTVSGTNTALGELTVPEESKTPIGKRDGSVLTLSGAGLAQTNGTYLSSGTYNGKTKFLGLGSAAGCSIFFGSNTWIVSTSVDPQLGNDYRYMSFTTNVDSPHLIAGWAIAGTPGTVGPVPGFASSAGWVKLNNSSFDADALNAAGGLMNDNWIFSDDHWLLATTKSHSSGLVIDSQGHNPLAWTPKYSTSFPANYAGDGDALAWRSYADGSYGWETSKVITQIPARWVARQSGLQNQDGLGGWGGNIQFYSENTATDILATNNWRKIDGTSQPASFLPIGVEQPGRWLLHAPNNSNDVYYEAVTNSFFPYGENSNGDSFDDQWTPRDPSAIELSSYQQSTNLPARWSLGDDTFYSATNSTTPWQAMDWKNNNGTSASLFPAQASRTIPAHWGLLNADGEEQYAAYSDSPNGAEWEIGQEPTDAQTPPDSVTEVDNYAPLEGKLAIKKKLLFDGQILAESSPWTENPDSKTYSFTFNLNTAEIDAEFDQEQEILEAMIELTWSSDGAVTSSFTIPATIYNDVIRGHEGPPTPPRSTLLAEMTGIAIVFGN